MKCKTRYADMEKFRAYRNNQKQKRNDRSREYAYNNGSRWKPEEVEMVIRHEMPDIEIAKLIGRTVQAVTIYRYKYYKRHKTI